MINKANLTHERPDHSAVFDREAGDGFNAAYRHSARVKTLKVALPLLAIGIALVFAWFTFFAKSAPTDLVIVNGGEGQDGRITMDQPKLEGYTKANMRYSLTAARAIQSPSKSGLIELEKINATLPLGLRGTATIEASGGIYDNINGRLRLTDQLIITTSDGMVAKLLSADVNLASSQLTTSEPVDITRHGEHLTAGYMRLQEKDHVVFFGGGVKLVIDTAIAHEDEN